MHVQRDKRLQAARRVGEVEFFSAFYSDLVCARRFFVVVRNAQVEHFELLCGGLACRFPVGHEVAYVVVCQLHLKPVGYDCHHVAFGGDIGHFGAGISPAVFPFELELSGLPAVGEEHAVGFVFDVCVRLDVAFQLVEAHQFVDECVFFLEEGRILCQLDALFHPGAVACHFQHTAFPGALRPDDDIHFLEGDVCFVQRAYISYDEVFHFSWCSPQRARSSTEVYFLTADLRGLVFIFIQSVLLCVLCGCLSYRCFSLKVYFIIETERSAGVCGKA